jgi:hypothetical protein
VVVEIFGAAVAALAMVAFYVDEGAAEGAGGKFFGEVLSFGLGGIEDVGVHGIEDGNLNIGDDEPNNEEVIKGEEGGEDGVTNYRDWFDHEY